MHLILDGTLLPALFVLAITIWACGSYVTTAGPMPWQKAVVCIISAFALVIATIVTVLALIGSFR